MACTKQTARKDTGGKPPAMGRGKKDPKKNPPPGKSADRKVVLEYSSDEEPQPAEGAGAPKRVKRQIHLTLPTSPAHVTMTESFTAFFINHRLTRALQKAFAKRGWSSDQMREFVTNFQKKHGQQVQCPKSMGTRTPLKRKVLSWQTGPKQQRRPRVVQEAPAGDNHERSQQPAAVLVLAAAGVVHMVVTAPVQLVQAGLEARSEVVTTTVKMMTPTNAGRLGVEVSSRNSRWLVRNHARRAQLTPNRLEVTTPLYLSPQRENRIGPPRTGLDGRAEKEDPQGTDAGEVNKTPQVQSGDCGSEGHPSFPRDHSAAHPKVAFPEGGEGDRPGLQDRPAIPVGGGTVSPRDNGGIPCQVV